jgi:hypothetical protein
MCIRANLSHCVVDDLARHDCEHVVDGVKEAWLVSPHPHSVTSEPRLQASALYMPETDSKLTISVSSRTLSLLFPALLSFLCVFLCSRSFSPAHRSSCCFRYAVKTHACPRWRIRRCTRNTAIVVIRTRPLDRLWRTRRRVAYCSNSACAGEPEGVAGCVACTYSGLPV